MKKERWCVQIQMPSKKIISLDCWGQTSYDEDIEIQCEPRNRYSICINASDYIDAAKIALLELDIHLANL